MILHTLSILICLGLPPSAGEKLQDNSPAAAAAAMVNGTPISLDEVQRQVQLMVRDREVEQSSQPVFQATALQQLVDRALALRYLEVQGFGASDAEVRLAIDRLEKQLAEKERSLEEYLQESRLDRAGLERALKWQLSWSKYLGQYLTDENLQRYFEQHRRHFDGTQLRVAHILLPVEDDADVQALQAAIRRAEEIREQIIGGEITFRDAAAKYSQAPTAAAGGDIGWIERRQPMPEPFSRAAFSLEPQAISESVVTLFGVHLLQVLEVRPGDKTWEEAHDELRRAVQRFLLEWMADRQRDQAQVEFTGNAPYFDPQSGRLVE